VSIYLEKTVLYTNSAAIAIFNPPFQRLQTQQTPLESTVIASIAISKAKVDEACVVYAQYSLFPHSILRN
jgi:hypothetical protein